MLTHINADHLEQKDELLRAAGSASVSQPTIRDALGRGEQAREDQLDNIAEEPQDQPREEEEGTGRYRRPLDEARQEGVMLFS